MLYDSMRVWRKQLHARINTITQQRMEIEAILSSMIEGVIAVDTDERIIIMNNAAATMFGCNISLVQGRSIQEAVRIVIYNNYIQRLWSGQKPVEKEITLPSRKNFYLFGHGTLDSQYRSKKVGRLLS